MARELAVAPEVAAALPASHLAQLQQDVLAPDNVCVACGVLIEGPRAELVVLHDDRAMLARLAHPECVASGVYGWPDTSRAIAGLTLRPDGVDVATGLIWRRAGAPRAILLIEPRIHISLDAGDADEDPLARLFAAPLALHPAAGSLAALRPPLALGTRIEPDPHRPGLRLRSPALTVTVPADAATASRWRAHADGDEALVLLGRGLGITGPDERLGETVAQALAVRPCWAARVAVT